MNRIWFRALSAPRLGVLMVLAFLAPVHQARACCSTSVPAFAYPLCQNPLQQSGGSSPILIPPHTGVTQPLNITGNVAACSLAVQPTSYGLGEIDLVQWDPLTLAPDPTTVALRTRGYDASSLQYTSNHYRADFTPPFVTRTIPGLADPPRSATAMDFHVTDSYFTQTAYFNPNGAGDVPIALQYVSGGPRSPLTGTHPVISHSVCGGDAFLQSLSVVQSVMTTNVLSDTSSFELIQRFRVPVEVKLRWVEVAFGVDPYRPTDDPGVLAILDAQGASTPPASLPTSLAEAFYSNCDFVTPFWGSHFDFDHVITLEPGHDYWLLARVLHEYLLYSRVATGNEGPAYTEAIGPFFSRTGANAGWSSVPTQALSFRVIGEPLGAVGVTPPVQSQSGLRLGVTPNPSKGAAFVIWSGARGWLRIEVLDARGRRVVNFSAGTTATGRWMWRGASDDGRRLPAGVYFVRATDGGGRVAIERVVLVR